MGLQADAADADERHRLARVVEQSIGERGDWILLKTCHRVELYGFGSAPNVSALHDAEVGDTAVRHLMRVAAGLESAIVGEDEVLHQVREALAQAQAARPLDSRLQRLFETAIAGGRRARAGRTASSGNLAQRAVAWLAHRSRFSGRTLLVVGAGRMGSALAHSAKLAGADVTIASRDATRARRLAKVYDGRGVDLAAGAELAPKSAGVAVALAGLWHELRPLEIELPPIADISAPAAIPTNIRVRLNGGFLGIDDLYVRPQAIPRGYIDEAERVVSAKTVEYMHWLEDRG
jgi:glutamyl-tRNA reductase